MISFFLIRWYGDYNNPLYYISEYWLAYITSQDDSTLPGDPGYNTFVKAVNEGFDRDSVDGLLRCNRLTKVYCGWIDEI